MHRATKVSLLAAVAMALGAGPASAPVVDSVSNGTYHFTPPPADQWAAIRPNPAADSVTFINTTRDGQIQLVVEPKDGSIDPGTADNVAAAIVKQLRETRARNKQVMVMPPRVEKDNRFSIVIHEKYKVGNSVADQLHVYRTVGPRTLMLTVNATADDAEKVRAIHAAGELVLEKVALTKKARK